MSDFEKQIHGMFDHIWDCEIEHPMFQDTVGELMQAVIQCYQNLPSAEPEIIRCKDCKFFVDHRCRYLRTLDDWRGTDEFCSKAERRKNK